MQPSSGGQHAAYPASSIVETRTRLRGPEARAYHARVTRRTTDDARSRSSPAVFPHEEFEDYELIDCGVQEKLERFGPVVMRRPDPQALWSRALSDAEWSRADLTFVRESDRGGRWESRRGAHPLAIAREPEWNVRFRACVFLVRPTPFKHVGIFPEQAANWSFVEDARACFDAERPRLLNLFGYTGASSVVAARAGYDVTHVDASKASLAWTRDNLRVSEVADDAVRIVLDDALSYARREARREARYHAVLLDPPHYGRGPRGEKWQFETDIAELVGAVSALLEERALVILSTYAIGCSPLALENLLADLGAGEVEAGELALPATGSRTSEHRAAGSPRPLPAGFCARWSRGLDLDKLANAKLARAELETPTARERDA
jgi:23S rRNA (cytosine1962-C5)-methyltransferase